MNRGLGISALFAGRERHRQVDGGRGDRQRPAARRSTGSTCRRWSASTSARRRRTCGRLFDAAEEGGALLFFDEADALFGKRSEVKDSHDRYANIEINYLLQRMEAYRGVAILATNMKSALDTAFMRRLRFIVDFPFPSAVERRLMWERAFPPATPDRRRSTWSRLAALPATGAMIHNIALGDGVPPRPTRTALVSMELILEVARAEFRKLELPTVERQFQWDEAVELSA